MNNNMDYKSVEHLINRVKSELHDEKLSRMFANCYGNTLNHTIKKKQDGSTFVITGDIPAMWLRDSVCQLRPYLVLCKEDEQIADLIESLIGTQFRYIAIDPYANAFNEEANGNGHQTDKTAMNPIIWERKYEIDSLCFPIQFSYLFWKNSGRTTHFTKEWKDTVKKIMEVFRVEQCHESKSEYRFERENCPHTDTLSRDGKGALVKENIGLVWSGFRPSDDACTYGYLIPSNMLLAVCLDYIGEISKEVYGDNKLALEARKFGAELREAIEKYARIPNSEAPYYAYEVDGYGQYLFMDDANLPSLLSIPYIGYSRKDDQTYLNTRDAILSSQNPYYYKGSAIEGIGSPHTPADYIWHIGLAMQGLTSDSKDEKLRILNLLRDSDGGTDFMHESVYVEDFTKFTRPWFSWANAVFSELVLDYIGIRLTI
jgi:Uncharacterized conserved protein